MTRQVRWCTSCILPDTRPNLVVGDDGVCSACRMHTRRPDIDWDVRRRDLTHLAERTKSSTDGYDCLIPVSGGKDSTWQVVECLALGLTPLAVTWKTPARTPIGQANLDNLVSLGVDHIDYQISPAVEAPFIMEAFRRLGDPAIPMHMALFNIPLTIAVRFRIPLVVWGENSAVEYGGEDGSTTLDADWLARYGVMRGTTAADWLGGPLTAKNMSAYRGPTAEELADAGVRAIFLGQYLPWDPEHTARVAGEHGFRTRQEGAKTGLWDYADIDDDFISVHHFLKWHKFGFTRLFDNLSLEIRNGRITREGALDVVRNAGDQTPEDDIVAFCDFVDITREEFDRICDGFRNPDIWQLGADGVWRMPQFVFPDWEWT